MTMIICTVSGCRHDTIYGLLAAHEIAAIAALKSDDEGRPTTRTRQHRLVEMAMYGLTAVDILLMDDQISMAELRNYAEIRGLFETCLSRFGTASIPALITA